MQPSAANEGENMAASFPPEGRLIHVANESQWNGIVTILEELGVKLFEIPAGPSVPDSGDVTTYGLMFEPTNK